MSAPAASRRLSALLDRRLLWPSAPFARPQKAGDGMDNDEIGDEVAEAAAPAVRAPNDGVWPSGPAAPPPNPFGPPPDNSSATTAAPPNPFGSGASGDAHEVSHAAAKPLLLPPSLIICCFAQVVGVLARTECDRRILMRCVLESLPADALATLLTTAARDRPRLGALLPLACAAHVSRSAAGSGKSVRWTSDGRVPAPKQAGAQQPLALTPP